MTTAATITPARYRLVRRAAAWMMFILSMALYAATAEPTVSYWDCPEYVTTAARLEPGHPPGNPVWMLTARMFTLFAPAPQWQALTVNLMSGVCSAAAVALIFLTISMMLADLTGLRRDAPVSRGSAAVVLSGAAIGAAALAVSDTFWFSAIEAEVYAFSAMLTALTFWLTMLWGEKRHEEHSARYLVLVAYITGLSIGVHQLNLLTLPALALIIIFCKRSNLSPLAIALSMLASLAAIGAILFAMMPASLAFASRFELFAVGRLALPVNAGAAAYALLTIIMLAAGAILCRTQRHIPLTIAVVLLALWLSGLTCFGGSILLGGAICAAAAIAAIFFRRHINLRICGIATWAATFLFLGYCAYGILLVRGAAKPPMNQGDPSDIFALTSYMQRDQYGSAPLIYGRTPESAPLYQEVLTTDSLSGRTSASYPRFFREPADSTYFPVDEGGRTRYVAMPRAPKLRYTPELNMWFPRIHSSDPADIDAYAGWCGMKPENMVAVETSFAVDSCGNAVGRLDSATGERTTTTRHRPTYLQNFAMLGGYQISYMYMRYLMWNFCGRQNEVYAQGEADAGNFITGFGPVDNLMLQQQKLMPADIGRENPGHHTYYMLPLLLGAVGISFMASAGKRGRRQLAVVALLFVLTGLAIVVYLNQTPGEPRERDYSFVGSFYAYCIWIGFGAAALLSFARDAFAGRRILRKIAAVAVVVAVVAVPAIMAAENFPDHNRAHRTITRDFAANVLAPLPENAVIFVSGDNYTFPLWYLQETELMRRDVRTVNLAYLSTPWYIIQLASPGPETAPLRLSIPRENMNPADLNLFGVVSIGFGTRDAREALSELFAQKPTEDRRPLIAADSLRFAVPGAPGDSLTLSLRDVAAGKPYIRLNKLLILDIAASNPDRPLFWSGALGAADRCGLDRHSFREALSLRFGNPAGKDTLTNTYNLISRHFRYGNLDKGIYVDLPGRQQTAIMRRLLASTAASLLDRDADGDRSRARRLADTSRTLMPPTSVDYTSHTENKQLYNDAIDLAQIYLRLGKMNSDPEALRIARSIALAEISRAAEYTRYLKALTPRFRLFTKGTTRLRRESLTLALLTYAEAGGDTVALRKSGLLDGINTDTERREAMRAKSARAQK